MRGVEGGGYMAELYVLVKHTKRSMTSEYTSLLVSTVFDMVPSLHPNSFFTIFMPVSLLCDVI